MLILPDRARQYADDIRNALTQGRYDDAARVSLNMSPARVAEIVRDMPDETLLGFLEASGAEDAAAVLAALPEPMTSFVIAAVPPARAALWLAHIPPDILKDVIDHLDEDDRNRILASLSEEMREEVLHLAQYPGDSAGALMSRNYCAVREDMVIGAVIESLREIPARLVRTGYIYVVDDKNRLSGVVSIRGLLLADHKATIAKIMEKDVIAVGVLDKAQEAARRLRSRRYKMIPVVYENGEMAGVITVEDAVDLLSLDLANSISGIGATSPEESFYTSPRQAVRMRLPWMAANVFLNLAAVSIIAGFESTIAQVAILAAFLPMITDMGGNVGIQALSVSIRSIALGEARLGDYWKATRKELSIGLCNGLVLGTLFGVIAYILETNWILGVVAGTALGVNVLVAGVVGGTIPFLIKRLGKDPAMMTGPVLTTITDITGVTIYLGLATLFLSGLTG